MPLSIQTEVVCERSSLRISARSACLHPHAMIEDEIFGRDPTISTLTWNHVYALFLFFAMPSKGYTTNQVLLITITYTWNRTAAAAAMHVFNMSWNWTKNAFVSLRPQILALDVTTNGHHSSHGLVRQWVAQTHTDRNRTIAHMHQDRLHS